MTHVGKDSQQSFDRMPIVITKKEQLNYRKKLGKNYI